VRTISAAPARVVIADDQPIARNGLRWMLESDPEILVVGEAGSSGLSALLRKHKADVLLLKFPTDPERTVEAIGQLATGAITARTVIMADTVDNPSVIRALEAGAQGVILKDSPAEVLFNSIRCVAAGGYWIDREEVKDLADSLRLLQARRRRSNPFGVTPRELEIIKAVVSGATNKEIGQTFSISENTVKRHLSHIFNKLGASNRVELALFAAHHRLLE
jgi:two-component system nitrate/nitrite response regulator NarL